jgi:hypothetical protein
MELYIAEYLVENRFADDIVSALKILKVVSDDWYGELINEVLTPEERAAKRAASQERRRMLGISQTDVDQSAAIRAGIRSRGASSSGGRVQSRTMNLSTPGQGRETTAQQRTGQQADAILRRNRSTGAGREAEAKRPTASPTFVGPGGRQPLASQGKPLTYDILRKGDQIKPGKPVIQTADDPNRAVAPGTRSTRRRSTRYSDDSNPPRG